jgi:hypothetical protein
MTRLNAAPLSHPIPYVNGAPGTHRFLQDPHIPFQKSHFTSQGNSPQQSYRDEKFLSRVYPIRIFEGIQCRNLGPSFRILKIFLTDVDQEIPFCNR